MRLNSNRHEPPADPDATPIREDMIRNITSADTLAGYLAWAGCTELASQIRSALAAEVTLAQVVGLVDKRVNR